MRGLLGEDQEFAKLAKKMKESFVFLNVYTQSVAEEHEPRGPEGPYRFTDRSVPVLVIKKWDGESLVHQLGFQPDPKLGKPALERYVETALKKNGPVVPPKALRPLIKNFNAGEKALAKGKPSPAWRALTKVVKAGNDAKKFPDGPPDVAVRAQKLIDAILKEAGEKIDATADLDDEARVKTLRKLLRTYSGIPSLKQRLRDEIKALG